MIALIMIAASDRRLVAPWNHDRIASDLTVTEVAAAEDGGEASVDADEGDSTASENGNLIDIAAVIKRELNQSSSKDTSVKTDYVRLLFCILSNSCHKFMG